MPFPSSLRASRYSHSDHRHFSQIISGHVDKPLQNIWRYNRGANLKHTTVLTNYWLKWCEKLSIFPCNSSSLTLNDSNLLSVEQTLETATDPLHYGTTDLLHHPPPHVLLFHLLQQIFRGNVDNNTPSANSFTPPIEAQYVRIYPQVCRRHCTLRMELLGCELTGEGAECI